MNNAENKISLKKRLEALPLKTNWVKIYLYIMMPIIIFIEFVLTANQLVEFTDPLAIISGLAAIIFTVMAMVFLLKAKKIGYYFNIITLILPIICILFIYRFWSHSEHYEAILVLYVLFYIIPWSVFNIVYFYRRRFVFFDEYIITKETEEGIVIEYCEYALNRLRENTYIKKAEEYRLPTYWFIIYVFYLLPIAAAINIL